MMGWRWFELHVAPALQGSSIQSCRPRVHTLVYSWWDRTLSTALWDPPLLASQPRAAQGREKELYHQLLHCMPTHK